MTDYSYAKGVLEAAESGEVILELNGLDWVPMGENLKRVSVDYLNNPSRVRIMPKPKMVPYTVETFPWSAVWVETGGHRYAILEVAIFGLKWSGGAVLWDELCNCDLERARVKILDVNGRQVSRGVFADG